jgi:8-amino-7-oxononanoate synthase
LHAAWCTPLRCLPRIAVILSSYQVFPGMQAEREMLQQLVLQFRAASTAYEKLDSGTPIQGIVVPGNEQAARLAEQLRQNGIDVRAILYPTVPKGRERLRIVLHAYNTAAELDRLIKLLQ